MVVPIKNERWLDHTGLNLIRIVIGSYFMAISLGLITGVDQSALFRPWLDAQTAQLAGTGVLFSLSMIFMSGVFLRMAALTLALFVLCSSAVGSFLSFEPQPISSFWRDLALVCAVLMSYSSLRRHELRNAALLMRRRAARIKRGKFSTVTPRRVSVQGKPASKPAAKAARRHEKAPDYDRALRPLIAPTGPIQRPETLADARSKSIAAQARNNQPDARTQRAEKAQTVARRLRLTPPPLDGDEDIDNIFSNI